ncbi:MAG TPA: ParA family partition ATPase [Alphaproteobacteria bacterium]|nr:ParA family partition ATPase [Alphaproteobacteria bacterium]
MPAYVITVAQQKGGSGKSTLAAHLSVAFAQMGYSTMLFDTDPQGTCSHWHAQRKKDDIGLIATSGWRLTRDLAMAREANDVIIIDTPPHAEMDIKVSTRAADLVVIPLQPSPADVWAVKETFNTVSGESRNALVVLNRAVFRANITAETKQKLAVLEVPVAETEIGSRVLFAASMETGMTVLDGFANISQAEVMSLVREIAAKIGLTLRTGEAGNVQTQQQGDATMVAKKKPAAKKKAPAKKKAAAKKKPAKKASSKKKGRLTQAAVEISTTDSRKQRKAA